MAKAKLFKSLVNYVKKKLTVRRSKGPKKNTPLDFIGFGFDRDFIIKYPTNPIEAMGLITELKAVHNLIGTAANRLRFEVKYLGQPHELFTTKLDMFGGWFIADYFVFGYALTDGGLSYYPAIMNPLQDGFTNELNHSIISDGLFVLKRELGTPLAFALPLVIKATELLRAELQALQTLGASGFLTPSSESETLPLTPQEAQEMRSMIREKLRRAGVGGLEFLPRKLEILATDIDISKYNLDKFRLNIIREVSNIFGIDSSLLNDTENKTYSNKDLALKALYTNTIIPLAIELSHKISNVFPELSININTSSIEVLHESKLAMTDSVVKLLSSGVISKEEARGLLELE